MMPRLYERRRLRKMAGLTVGESICDIDCVHHPHRYLAAKRVVGFDREEVDVSLPYMDRIVGERY